MEAPVLMVAQTVPTSARYIDKLWTVGARSAGRETRLQDTDFSPRVRPQTAAGGGSRTAAGSLDASSKGQQTAHEGLDF